MRTLAERLAWARTQANMTQQELAKATGIAQSTIASWESGARETGRKITAVADYLRINPVWLAEGKGEPQLDLADISRPAMPGAMAVTVLESDSPDVVHIPKVKLRLRAGVTGFQTEPDTGHGSTTTGVFRSWVNRKGYNAEQLISFEVHGESMEPTFYEGDIVVINLADKQLIDNGVYAINYEGEAVIKRLSRDAGQWWLMSDNPDQRKYYRRRCAGVECIVIGRVVYRQGENF